MPALVHVVKFWHNIYSPIYSFIYSFIYAPLCHCSWMNFADYWQLARNLRSN